MSHYETYKAAISHVGSDTWTPFVSHLDWEFVRWAKLHDPGSTAVNELLKIEGVCLFTLSSYTIFITVLFSDCIPPWLVIQKLL